MYRRILVATDGSDTARRAVDRAAEVTESPSAHLTVPSAGGEQAARRFSPSVRSPAR